LANSVEGVKGVGERAQESGGGVGWGEGEQDTGALVYTRDDGAVVVVEEGD
jgi:hypothetical protein